MGCAQSVLAVAELNKSLKSGNAGEFLLDKLHTSPWLFSTATSVLNSTAGTPLHIACERKQAQVVQQMLSFLSCAPLPTVREALLPYCRRSGHQLPASVAEGVLIAVEMVNCKGQTPLMYACAAGSPELVKLLLSQGADPWVGDRCGARTALHYAAMAGSAPCIEALIQNLSTRHMARQGVRYVDVRTQCGLSALHYAVFFDQPRAVEELLRHDPQLNAASSSHSYDMSISFDTFSTPLHFAAFRGSAAIARQLLQYQLLRAPASGRSRSQDPRLRSNFGHQLPWQVAASNHPSNRELVALLHPGQPLERALGLAEGEGAAAGSSARVGAPSLAAIAAAALRDKLGADIRRVQPEVPAKAPGAKAGKAGEQAGAAAGEEARRCSGAAGSGEGPTAGAAASAPGGCQLQRSLTARSGTSCQQQEEEGLCGVCFAEREAVAPAGCGHGICGRCAAELCRGALTACRPRPLMCPFCRGHVAAFTAAARRSPAGEAPAARRREEATPAQQPKQRQQSQPRLQQQLLRH